MTGVKYLKDFQQKAVKELSETFLDLWKTGNYQIPLILKAPTGAGKTIMMAEFLRCLDDNYQFHEDKAYLWISFGGDDSYTQSKKKLYQYFNEGTDMNLKDLNNLNEGKLHKNNIFFINWLKIKGTNKESKKLRKSGGVGYGGEAIFDEFIKQTRKERGLILIVDEAHIETDTHLAKEVVDLFDPRIIIKVTATPKIEPSFSDVKQKRVGFVEVSEKDVIESGLIKEKIVIQTKEEIEKLSKKKQLSEGEIMLELAYNKRIELKKIYEKLELDINPLVLIQLPSDFKEKEVIETNQKDFVLLYLKAKGVKEKEIAIWLSNEKTNLDTIEENNNEVNFMIFKVAPATGWDCPRAEILVMFREIDSPIFHTQIIGRIKRMSEGYHYEREELNKAYIFTNYNKNHIKDISELENKNKIPIYFTELKKDIERICLETTYHHQTDFDILVLPLWQKVFLEVMDQKFGTKPYLVAENKKKVGTKINFSLTKVSNQIIVDAEITSFDNFANEIKRKGQNFDYHFSQLEVEKFYNLLCFQELKNQGDKEIKYNPASSWGQMKSALNVWFETRFGFNKANYYPIIVNEISKENSDLKIIISKTLKEFRKKYEIEIKAKEKREVFDLWLPEKQVSFTSDFEKIESINKNVYEKFYNRKQYLGIENEKKFIRFLESQPNIIWWHKQSYGRNAFAIEYFDMQEKENRLFYPDFIVRTKSKVYLLDTKSGITAKSQETADKSNALQNWIKEKQSKYNFEIIGGIVIEKYPNWKINISIKYAYERENDWKDLSFSN
ncbi:DEAD/DEAH box helicase [endosymbiont GvMRE of Glomus versiforme]|uniref:DEAD/DEAH box helicase n=1 Tax=endosymbiont GvMRE of Glomus versiforme TaxID=2039283 RepID=UPI000EDE838C|nr:DEAD/DEAH box helicase family protein [endosymbiont GvMRE of Glomus versiforme]RHZ36526.1 Type III restriction enzyme, res subunit [endosymbiont GvMRE of Glomus versiforme]